MNQRHDVTGFDIFSSSQSTALTACQLGIAKSRAKNKLEEAYVIVVLKKCQQLVVCNAFK